MILSNGQYIKLKRQAPSMQGKFLGSGTYSEVREESGYAVKRIQYKYFDSVTREIALIGMCNHDGVIKINQIDYGYIYVRLYMKKYDCNLWEFIKKQRPLKINDIQHIARGIISAVNHIHNVGIIHGDLKPENILLEHIDGQWSPIVCDFGISVLSCEKYHTSKVQTQTYRAPEVDDDKNRIQYTTKIDIWSLGCILFGLAAGDELIKYNHSDDSSEYACGLYKISTSGTRAQRMRLLRAVNKPLAIQRVNELLTQHQKYGFGVMPDAGFIELIASCLLPDHKVRISASQASEMIGIIDDKKYSAPIIPETPIHDISCIVNIPKKIIEQCTMACLRLAEYIYRKFMVKTNDSRREMKYAALFISACIHSGSSVVNNDIEDIIDISVLRSAVALIVITLGGRVV